MYANASYLNNSILEFTDDSQPLVVGSCGNYRVSGDDLFHTKRPKGRRDYQLLYVASGKAHFTVEGQLHSLPAGNMVIYRPGQPQDYVYYGEDHPEIYWVHFTGSEAENILRHYGICESVFYSGNSEVYAKLFQQIIRELKTCGIGFEELLAMYLKQILVQVRRSRAASRIVIEPKLQAQMEQAIQDFHEHYMEPVCIADYAKSSGMSVSWFLRCFKQYTKQSPMQYITALRINNAVNLLENTSYNVSEIAAMVGYENPLYFSRIFHKIKGVSPSRYRKVLDRSGG